eukprot:5198443-Amphidinium_carterae.2
MPGAFLHADMDESRTLVCQPPNILCEFNLIPDGEYWQLVKALYGLREAPKYWEASRDEALREFRMQTSLGVLCLVQSCIHASVWPVVTEQEKGRLEAARNHHLVDKRALGVFNETFPLSDCQTVSLVKVHGLVTVYVDDMLTFDVIWQSKHHACLIKTRHISIRGHRLSEAIAEKTCMDSWVDTKSQPADFLTKTCPALMKSLNIAILGLERVPEMDVVSICFTGFACFVSFSYYNNLVQVVKHQRDAVNVPCAPAEFDRLSTC